MSEIRPKSNATTPAQAFQNRAIGCQSQMLGCISLVVGIVILGILGIVVLAYMGTG